MYRNPFFRRSTRLLCVVRGGGGGLGVDGGGGGTTMTRRRYYSDENSTSGGSAGSSGDYSSSLSSSSPRDSGRTGRDPVNQRVQFHFSWKPSYASEEAMLNRTTAEGGAPVFAPEASPEVVRQHGPFDVVRQISDYMLRWRRSIGQPGTKRDIFFGAATYFNMLPFDGLENIEAVLDRHRQRGEYKYKQQKQQQKEQQHRSDSDSNATIGTTKTGAEGESGDGGGGADGTDSTDKNDDNENKGEVAAAAAVAPTPTLTLPPWLDDVSAAAMISCAVTMRIPPAECPAIHGAFVYMQHRNLAQVPPTSLVKLLAAFVTFRSAFIFNAVVDVVHSVCTTLTAYQLPDANQQQQQQLTGNSSSSSSSGSAQVGIENVEHNAAEGRRPRRPSSIHGDTAAERTKKRLLLYHFAKRKLKWSEDTPKDIRTSLHDMVHYEGQQQDNNNFDPSIRYGSGASSSSNNNTAAPPPGGDAGRGFPALSPTNRWYSVMQQQQQQQQQQQRLKEESLEREKNGRAEKEEKIERRSGRGGDDQAVADKSLSHGEAASGQDSSLQDVEPSALINDTDNFFDDDIDDDDGDDFDMKVVGESSVEVGAGSLSSHHQRWSVPPTSSSNAAQSMPTSTTADESSEALETYTPAEEKTDHHQSAAPPVPSAASASASASVPPPDNGHHTTATTESDDGGKEGKTEGVQIEEEKSVGVEAVVEGGKEGGGRRAEEEEEEEKGAEDEEEEEIILEDSRYTFLQDGPQRVFLRGLSPPHRRPPRPPRRTPSVFHKYGSGAGGVPSAINDPALGGVPSAYHQISAVAENFKYPYHKDSFFPFSGSPNTPGVGTSGGAAAAGTTPMMMNTYTHNPPSPMDTSNMSTNTYHPAMNPDPMPIGFSRDSTEYRDWIYRHFRRGVSHTAGRSPSDAIIDFDPPLPNVQHLLMLPPPPTPTPSSSSAVAVSSTEIRRPKNLVETTDDVTIRTTAADVHHIEEADEAVDVEGGRIGVIFRLLQPRLHQLDLLHLAIAVNALQRAMLSTTPVAALMLLLHDNKETNDKKQQNSSENDTETREKNKNHERMTRSLQQMLSYYRNINSIVGSCTENASASFVMEPEQRGRINNESKFHTDDCDLYSIHSIVGLSEADRITSSTSSGAGVADADDGGNGCLQSLRRYYYNQNDFTQKEKEEDGRAGSSTSTSISSSSSLQITSIPSSHSSTSSPFSVIPSTLIDDMLREITRRTDMYLGYNVRTGVISSSSSSNSSSHSTATTTSSGCHPGGSGSSDSKNIELSIQELLLPKWSGMTTQSLSGAVARSSASERAEQVVRERHQNHDSSGMTAEEVHMQELGKRFSHDWSTSDFKQSSATKTTDPYNTFLQFCAHMLTSSSPTYTGSPSSSSVVEHTSIQHELISHPAMKALFTLMKHRLHLMQGFQVLEAVHSLRVYAQAVEGFCHEHIYLEAEVWASSTGTGGTAALDVVENGWKIEETTKKKQKLTAQRIALIKETQDMIISTLEVASGLAEKFSHVVIDNSSSQNNNAFAAASSSPIAASAVSRRNTGGIRAQSAAGGTQTTTSTSVSRHNPFPSPASSGNAGFDNVDDDTTDDADADHTTATTGAGAGATDDDGASSSSLPSSSSPSSHHNTTTTTTNTTTTVVLWDNLTDARLVDLIPSACNLLATVRHLEVALALLTKALKKTETVKEEGSAVVLDLGYEQQQQKQQKRQQGQQLDAEEKEIQKEQTTERHRHSSLSPSSSLQQKQDVQDVLLYLQQEGGRMMTHTYAVLDHLFDGVARRVSAGGEIAINQAGKSVANQKAARRTASGPKDITSLIQYVAERFGPGPWIPATITHGRHHTAHVIPTEDASQLHHHCYTSSSTAGGGGGGSSSSTSTVGKDEGGVVGGIGPIAASANTTYEYDQRRNASQLSPSSSPSSSSSQSGLFGQAGGSAERIAATLLANDPTTPHGSYMAAGRGYGLNPMPDLLDTCVEAMEKRADQEYGAEEVTGSLWALCRLGHLKTHTIHAMLWRRRLVTFTPFEASRLAQCITTVGWAGQGFWFWSLSLARCTTVILDELGFALSGVLPAGSESTSSRKQQQHANNKQQQPRNGLQLSQRRRRSESEIVVQSLCIAALRVLGAITGYIGHSSSTDNMSSSSTKNQDKGSSSYGTISNNGTAGSTDGSGINHHNDKRHDDSSSSSSSTSSYYDMNYGASENRLTPLPLDEPILCEVFGSLRAGQRWCIGSDDSTTAAMLQKRIEGMMLFNTGGSSSRGEGDIVDGNSSGSSAPAQSNQDPNTRNNDDSSSRSSMIAPTMPSKSAEAMRMLLTEKLKGDLSADDNEGCSADGDLLDSSELFKRTQQSGRTGRIGTNRQSPIADILKEKMAQQRQEERKEKSSTQTQQQHQDSSSSSTSASASQDFFFKTRGGFSQLYEEEKFNVSREFSLLRLRQNYSALSMIISHVLHLDLDLPIASSASASASGSTTTNTATAGHAADGIGSSSIEKATLTISQKDHRGSASVAQQQQIVRIAELHHDGGLGRLLREGEGGAQQQQEAEQHAAADADDIALFPLPADAIIPCLHSDCPDELLTYLQTRLALLVGCHYPIHQHQYYYPAARTNMMTMDVGDAGSGSSSVPHTAGGEIVSDSYSNNNNVVSPCSSWLTTLIQRAQGIKRRDGGECDNENEDVGNANKASRDDEQKGERGAGGKASDSDAEASVGDGEADGDGDGVLLNDLAHICALLPSLQTNKAQKGGSVRTSSENDPVAGVLLPRHVRAGIAVRVAAVASSQWGECVRGPASAPLCCRVLQGYRLCGASILPDAEDLCHIVRAFSASTTPATSSYDNDEHVRGSSSIPPPLRPTTLLPTTPLAFIRMTLNEPNAASWLFEQPTAELGAFVLEALSPIVPDGIRRALESDTLWVAPAAPASAPPVAEQSQEEDITEKDKDVGGAMGSNEADCDDTGGELKYEEENDESNSNHYDGEGDHGHDHDQHGGDGVGGGGGGGPHPWWQVDSLCSRAPSGLPWRRVTPLIRTLRVAAAVGAKLDAATAGIIINDVVSMPCDPAPLLVPNRAESEDWDALTIGRCHRLVVAGPDHVPGALLQGDNRETNKKVRRQAMLEPNRRILDPISPAAFTIPPVRLEWVADLLAIPPSTIDGVRIDPEDPDSTPEERQDGEEEGEAVSSASKSRSSSSVSSSQFNYNQCFGAVTSKEVVRLFGPLAELSTNLVTEADSRAVPPMLALATSIANVAPEALRGVVYEPVGRLLSQMSCVETVQVVLTANTGRPPVWMATALRAISADMFALRDRLRVFRHSISSQRRWEKNREFLNGLQMSNNSHRHDDSGSAGAWGTQQQMPVSSSGSADQQHQQPQPQCYYADKRLVDQLYSWELRPSMLISLLEMTIPPKHRSVVNQLLPTQLHDTVSTPSSPHQGASWEAARAASSGSRVGSNRNNRSSSDAAEGSDDDNSASSGSTSSNKKLLDNALGGAASAFAAVATSRDNWAVAMAKSKLRSAILDLLLILAPLAPTIFTTRDWTRLCSDRSAFGLAATAAATESSVGGGGGAVDSRDGGGAAATTSTADGGNSATSPTSSVMSMSGGNQQVDQAIFIVGGPEAVLDPKQCPQTGRSLRPRLENAVEDASAITLLRMRFALPGICQSFERLAENPFSSPQVRDDVRRRVTAAAVTAIASHSHSVEEVERERERAASAILSPVMRKHTEAFTQAVQAVSEAAAEGQTLQQSGALRRQLSAAVRLQLDLPRLYREALVLATAEKTETPRSDGFLLGNNGDSGSSSSSASSSHVPTSVASDLDQDVDADDNNEGFSSSHKEAISQISNPGGLLRALLRLGAMKPPPPIPSDLLMPEVQSGSFFGSSRKSSKLAREGRHDRNSSRSSASASASSDDDHGTSGSPVDGVHRPLRKDMRFVESMTTPKEGEVALKTMCSQLVQRLSDIYREDVAARQRQQQQQQQHKHQLQFAPRRSLHVMRQRSPSSGGGSFLGGGVGRSELLPASAVGEILTVVPPEHRPEYFAALRGHFLRDVAAARMHDVSVFAQCYAASFFASCGGASGGLGNSNGATSSASSFDQFQPMTLYESETFLERTQQLVAGGGGAAASVAAGGGDAGGPLAVAASVLVMSRSARGATPLMARIALDIIHHTAAYSGADPRQGGSLSFVARAQQRDVTAIDRACRGVAAAAVVPLALVKHRAFGERVAEAYRSIFDQVLNNCGAHLPAVRTFVEEKQRRIQNNRNSSGTSGSAAQQQTESQPKKKKSSRFAKRGASAVEEETMTQARVAWMTFEIWVGMCANGMIPSSLERAVSGYWTRDIQGRSTLGSTQQQQTSSLLKVSMTAHAATTGDPDAGAASNAGALSSPAAEASSRSGGSPNNGSHSDESLLPIFPSSPNASVVGISSSSSLKDHKHQSSTALSQKDKVLLRRERESVLEQEAAILLRRTLIEAIRSADTATFLAAVDLISVDNPTLAKELME